MLSAEYADRKACPHCGFPARRLGRWSIEKGEWYFHPQPISARSKRGNRPEWGGEFYTNIPRRIETTDRQGRTVEVEEDEWHDLRHYECMGNVYGDCKADAPLRDCEVTEYRGIEHEWMRAPSPPERKAPSTAPLAAEWKRAAAGDRDG